VSEKWVVDCGRGERTREEPYEVQVPQPQPQQRSARRVVSRGDGDSGRGNGRGNGSEGGGAGASVSGVFSGEHFTCLGLSLASAEQLRSYVVQLGATFLAVYDKFAESEVSMSQMAHDKLLPSIPPSVTYIVAPHGFPHSNAVRRLHPTKRLVTPDFVRVSASTGRVR
jgi:hypothetical protein